MNHPLGCDTHLHFYDHRYPATGGNAFPDRAPADYRTVQKRLGLGRLVVVQPSRHGTDNRPTLNAIAAFGTAARGVAVVRPDTPDDELQRLHQGGIRGVRLYLRHPRDAFPLTLDALEPLAGLAQRMGWHLQLNLPPELLVTYGPVLRRLDVPLVFDHLAKIPQPSGVDSREFAVVRELLAERKAWLKISAPYLTSTCRSETFADLGETVRALADVAPDRLLWGSNWPHPTLSPAPDDRTFLELVRGWLPGPAEWEAMLIRNPAVLYGFENEVSSAK
ncbi:amidohydrolase family protein [Amycolatopsis sp. FU40]|uniref:amidohydrolase family protein n=1 Tax=Amycolatopsis sp. FU40 TaxID=2914159 RepID=UPI001F31F383|nr:amidohydrolase family protein [Amycolatopsis sp. FU40]UKD57069.1 amidohydrolase family protein [Amycolatopsis sp. FU40]